MNGRARQYSRRQALRLGAAGAVAVSVGVPLDRRTAHGGTGDPVVLIDWSAFPRESPGDADSLRIRDILLNSNKYGLTTWYETRYGDQEGTYLDFGGVGESQIRPPAEEVLGLAASIATGVYDPAWVGVSLNDAKAKTRRLIGSLAFHHRASSIGGWGDAWQSAYWAYAAGYAGWLLWGELSATDQDMVRNMVEHEADRFVDYEVPYYRDTSGEIIRPGDTAAEENAWNANLLQLATAMMPKHGHWELWMDKCLELMVSAFSRPSDVASPQIINGKPLNEWLNGSNINEEGTLVNHGLLHPDYMAANSLNHNAAATYSLAGMATPKAAFFNSNVVYDAIVDLSFPSPPNEAPGGTMYVRESADVYYPHGYDNGTHRRMGFTLLDVQARAYGLDDMASVPAEVWERLHAGMVFEMQGRFEDGRTYGDWSEHTAVIREEWVAARAAQAYLTKWVTHQGAVELTNRAYPLRPSVTLPTLDLFRVGQPYEVNAVFENEGLTAVTNVELALTLSVDWNVAPTSATQFSQVSAGESVTATWQITPPADAESSQMAELEAIASYRSLGTSDIAESTQRGLLAVGENVAVDKPVIAYSSQDSRQVWWASNINDGRVDSESRGWAARSGATNQWVVIDLNREYTLSALRIINEPEGPALMGRNVKDFVLYGSPTGEFEGEEFVIHSGTLPPLAHLETWSDAFEPATTRYVKFLGQNSYSQFILVGELELFGQQ